MLNQLLSNRVEKTPSTEVSADRYEYLALAEAEPDLGVPAGNSYILASTTTGTRSWINPATALPAPGSSTQVIFNNSGILAGATGLVYDTATGRVGIGVASPTAELELAETWNNAGTTFTHIKSNVTDTASASTSKILDFKLNDNDRLNLTKNAVLTIAGSDISQSGASVVITGSDRNVTLRADADGGNANGLTGPSFFRASKTGRNLILGALNANGTISYFRLETDDVSDTLAQRRGTNAQTSRIYNTFTDASNYERATLGWNTNVLEIGTEAAGTGIRRQIKLNYTTTIDGNSRTNVPALTISNVGAGTGGIALGVLNIGHSQDQSRITGFDVPNKALSYAVRGSAISGQGAHRFSGDTTTGTTVGSTGSIVDILAPSTATNIFQCRQSDGTVTLNVGYSGAITIANTVAQSTEATTLATTTKTQVASFPVATFRSGKLIAQAYDSVTGEVQISELLVAHNGTTASSTEYGVVHTGSSAIVLYDVDISAGNVRLMATRTSANSTQYKISETLIVA